MRFVSIVFFGGGFVQSAHMTVKNTLVLQTCIDALTVKHGLCSEQVFGLLMVAMKSSV